MKKFKVTSTQAAIDFECLVEDYQPQEVALAIVRRRLEDIFGNLPEDLEIQEHAD